VGGSLASRTKGEIDRRTLLKAIVAGGVAGAAAAIAASTRVSLPAFETEEPDEPFIYVAGDQPNPYGFDALAGRDARADDFSQAWMGAAALWRALRDADGTPIPGTGFPALLIRVDPDLLEVPPEWVAGEDFLADPTILAFFDRCTHTCCFPQWHTEVLPSSLRDYEPGRSPRTFLAGQDPIWCRCHNGQYDPLTLEWDVHPDGVRYVGARWSRLPVSRALPAISVREEGGRVVGAKWLEPPPRGPPGLGSRDAEWFRDWYFAYCR
jgi:Rieske Fe-S protein